RAASHLDSMLALCETVQCRRAQLLTYFGQEPSAIAAFFYIRVIVLMFFSEPKADGPTVAVPSPLMMVTIGVGVVVVLVFGIAPQYVLDLARQVEDVRALSPYGRRRSRDGLRTYVAARLPPRGAGPPRAACLSDRCGDLRGRRLPDPQLGALAVEQGDALLQPFLYDLGLAPQPLEGLPAGRNRCDQFVLVQVARHALKELAPLDLQRPVEGVQGLARSLRVVAVQHVELVGELSALVRDPIPGDALQDSGELALALVVAVSQGQLERGGGLPAERPQLRGDPPLLHRLRLLLGFETACDRVESMLHLVRHRRRELPQLRG
ncbi:RecQ family zinc-binding domain-containing protein, partial [Streptomyces sp. NPDC047803]|uniref:RecQ family zinc-binding domain-containing protein n=1 Tax=Streptomyces sp. NPDC047803 TaxID=3160976 RepID=UPI0034042A5F